ncbi:hypothetical protein [Burkholderia phage BCSR5]|nr:hypothetical protein [Burkholderia phage BCSR5]
MSEVQATQADQEVAATEAAQTEAPAAGTFQISKLKEEMDKAGYPTMDKSEGWIGLDHEQYRHFMTFVHGFSPRAAADALMHPESLLPKALYEACVGAVKKVEELVDEVKEDLGFGDDASNGDSTEPNGEDVTNDEPKEDVKEDVKEETTEPEQTEQSETTEQSEQTETAEKTEEVNPEGTADETEQKSE